VTALAPFRPGIPKARANLVALNDSIADTEKRLRTLQDGKTALERELGRASAAREELAELVAADAKSLVDRLRSGATWALSAITQTRTHSVAAQLNQCRVEASVGEKALDAAAEEISALQRDLADFKGRKQSAILSVVQEASSGYVADIAVLADDLRQLLAIVGGLDRLTTRNNTGEFVPTSRITVTLPGLGGVPEQVVVAPNSSIEEAKKIWGKFAAALDKDALASVDDLVFPHCNGTEDSSTTVYSELSSVERRAVDMSHALGVN
jgi:hypothetical protein